MEIKCYNQTNNAIREDRGMSEYKYKYNAKTVAYNSQYVKEHYDVYNLKMPIGMKDKLKDKAKSEGLSVNQYLIDLISKQL